MAKENPNYVKGRHGNYKYCGKNISAVYIIINDISKEFYIGSSVDVNTRLIHHFGDLKRNVHNTERFQTSFDKHGYDNFSFYLLYISQNEEFIREKELELIQDNHNNPLLLNTSTINNSWANERNSEKLEKYKAKLSKIASSRIGVKNPFYGRSHSKETKEKLRKLHLGRKPANSRKVLIDDIEYESLAEAAKALNVSNGTIVHRMKSSNPKYKNYHYIT